MDENDFTVYSRIAEERLMSRIMASKPDREPQSAISGSWRLRRSTSAWCHVCKKPVGLLSFSAAAAAFNTDLQDIGFLADRGEIHRLHNRYAELMICRDSLFECFDRRETRIFTLDQLHSAR
jgi:hypothetical protein